MSKEEVIEMDGVINEVLPNAVFGITLRERSRGNGLANAREIYVADMNTEMWLFFSDAVGKQQWHRLDAKGNTLQESHRGFDDRYQCVEDAKRFGYVGRAAGIQSL